MTSLAIVAPSGQSRNHDRIPLATVRLPAELAEILESGDTSHGMTMRFGFDGAPNLFTVQGRSYEFRLGDRGDTPVDLLQRIPGNEGSAEAHLFAHLAKKIKVFSKVVEPDVPKAVSEARDGKKRKASGSESPASVTSGTHEDNEASKAQLDDRQQRLVLQHLAAKGPVEAGDAKGLAIILKVRVDALLEHLPRIAILKNGLWDLKPESFRSVEVESWNRYDARDRERVAKRMNEAFTAIGLPLRAPEWKKMQGYLKGAATHHHLPVSSGTPDRRASREASTTAADRTHPRKVQDHSEEASGAESNAETSKGLPVAEAENGNGQSLAPKGPKLPRFKRATSTPGTGLSPAPSGEEATPTPAAASPAQKSARLSSQPERTDRSRSRSSGDARPRFKNEQEYREAVTKYTQMYRDLQDVRERIETIQRRFRRKRAEVEGAKSSGSGSGSGSPSNAVLRLALELKADGEQLERLQREYMRLHTELGEIRRKME